MLLCAVPRRKGGCDPPPRLGRVPGRSLTTKGGGSDGGPPVQGRRCVLHDAYGPPTQWQCEAGETRRDETRRDATRRMYCPYNTTAAARNPLRIAKQPWAPQRRWTACAPSALGLARTLLHDSFGFFAAPLLFRTFSPKAKTCQSPRVAAR